MPYIDSHAHIDGELFNSDRDETIERARTAGVDTILNVCAGSPTEGAFESAVALAGKHERIFAAVGVHPHDARVFDDCIADRLLGIISNNPKVIALGEIGLDYHYDYSPREVQREAFARQLRIARDRSLPVIIHSRAADSDTVQVLRDEWFGSDIGGIMHCFGGSLETAQVLLKEGFLISFAGNVTFKNADNLRAVARQIPLEKLLIETDCPFLTPVPYRGRRNEPARVVEVAKCIADLHGTTAEDIGRITSENFLTLFGASVALN